MKALLLGLFVVAASISWVALGAPIDPYDPAPGSLVTTTAVPAVDDAPAELAPDSSPVPPMLPVQAPTSQLLTAIAIGTLFLWRLQAAHRPARRRPAMHW